MSIIRNGNRTLSNLRKPHAPGAHIFTAGCTIFGGVHPVCARFLSHFVLLYIGRVHVPFSGCTVLGEVHPVSAQNKSLISDTEGGCLMFEDGHILGDYCTYDTGGLLYNIYNLLLFHMYLIRQTYTCFLRVCTSQYMRG